jgi:hypothetical protein
MMRSDIVEIEAEQRLSRIVAVEPTPEAIDRAFDELIGELATIADLSTPRRKHGMGKGRAWWCPAVQAAYAAAKREHRSYIATPSDFRWQRYRQAINSTTKTVEEAKSSSWRRAIAATAHKQDDLWKLERWARLRSWAPPESVTIPPLRRSEDGPTTHTSHISKAELFAERFFSNPRADSEALQAARERSPSGQFTMSQRVTADETEDILRGTKPWKAPGDDNLPAGLLKACRKPLFRALATLVTSSFQAAHFPKRFKTAKVTILPKLNKTMAQKSTPGAWRPISLLNSAGKVVEAAFARRITDVAEAQKLLPDGQMGNRRHRSTEVAVKMVVEAATEARRSGGIASLLQLDIKGAFDSVHHQWMIQILRLAGYPPWSQQWISSYLADREAYFAFDNQRSIMFKIAARVPQGSPLSPVLFLLYIATLYTDLKAAHPRLFIIGFANDTNLLAVNSTIKANKRLLKAAWGVYQQWAQKTGIMFAPEKSELLHFSGSGAAITLPLRLGNKEIQPSYETRLLEIWLNRRLNCKSYLIRVKTKMATQMLTFSKLAALA